MTIRVAAVLPIALVLLSGCAMKPRPAFIDVTPAKSSPIAEVRDRVVYVRAIRDLRQFTLNATTPETPSLSTATELKPDETAKAVAQIRSASGVVAADVFLKDQTVLGLIKTALTDAFSTAGYRVVEMATGPTDIAVDVDVVDFWAYNTGSWTFTFTAVIGTLLKADSPGVVPEKEVRTRLSLRSAVAATPTSFRNTLTKALEQYSRELSARLRSTR